jgi:hypothetical protein
MCKQRCWCQPKACSAKAIKVVLFHAHTSLYVSCFQSAAASLRVRRGLASSNLLRQRQQLNRHTMYWCTCCSTLTQLTGCSTRL